MYEVSKRVAAIVDKLAPALGNMVPGPAEATADIFPGLLQGIHHDHAPFIIIKNQRRSLVSFCR
jgi:hypothetical protein